MPDNPNEKPPVIKHIPEMLVKERAKYISDAMMYEERKLSYLRFY